jgi:hypothetical protein
MKRLGLVVLACSLASCGLTEPSVGERLVGDWTLVRINDDVVPGSVKVCFLCGSDFWAEGRLSLRADGSCQWSSVIDGQATTVVGEDCAYGVGENTGWLRIRGYPPSASLIPGKGSLTVDWNDGDCAGAGWGFPCRSDTRWQLRSAP